MSGLRPALVLVAMVAVAGCAKKMLPPSPDRFAPRLLSINARARTQVELEFDEALDPSHIRADSIELSAPDGSRVELRGALPGRKATAAQLWADLQPGVVYRLRGTVRDEAGNRGAFRGRFVASARTDTISPRLRRLEPQAGATGRLRSSAVSVRFTEALDTLVAPRWFFVPRWLDSLYSFAWDADWQGFRLRTEDSLPAGMVGYFVLLPGVRDLDGNLSRDPAFTYFTSDSLMPERSLRGAVRYRPGRFGTGVVFFGESLTTGAAVFDSSGRFVVKPPAPAGLVVAVADTNGDGLADLVSDPVAYRREDDSIDIELRPEQPPRPIDVYRR